MARHRGVRASVTRARPRQSSPFVGTVVATTRVVARTSRATKGEAMANKGTCPKFRYQLNSDYYGLRRACCVCGKPPSDHVDPDGFEDTPCQD